jgi:hypothetical protein
MTYTPQTSVTDRRTRIQGRVNAFDQVSTSVRTADGATAIDPGMAVIKSTADYDVILPAAAFTEIQFQGVVALSLTDKEQALSTGDKSYVANDELSIVTDGIIEVLVTDTVAKDGVAYFVHTTGGASTIHTWRSDADTDKASSAPAIFLEDGVTGDIVKIKVSDGARIGTALP